MLLLNVGRPKIHDEFVSYGSSKFEEPHIGSTFREEGSNYKIVKVCGAQWNPQAAIDRVWKFRFICERLDRPHSPKSSVVCISDYSKTRQAN